MLILPDNTLPKAARHEALRLYHFKCDCPRCKDDLDVYEVCRASPHLRLNSFSLQPDLAKLRSPSIDRTKVSKEEIEAIYKKWKALGEPEGKDEEDHLRLAQARWEVCRPLVEAKMWAVEPLPTTISQLAARWQTSHKMVVYALPLLCFASTECDPIKLVAPFMPWRIKGVMAIAMLLAVTGEFTASGGLATRCTHEGLVGTLAMADQVSMCEALLRLVVHHGSIGASEDWGCLKKQRPCWRISRAYKDVSRSRDFFKHGQETLRTQKRLHFSRARCLGPSKRSRLLPSRGWKQCWVGRVWSRGRGEIGCMCYRFLRLLRRVETPFVALVTRLCDNCVPRFAASGMRPVPSVSGKTP